MGEWSYAAISLKSGGERGCRGGVPGESRSLEAEEVDRDRRGQTARDSGGGSKSDGGGVAHASNRGGAARAVARGVLL